MPTKNTKNGADALGGLDGLIADAVTRSAEADRARADREQREQRAARAATLEAFRGQLAATLGEDVGGMLSPLADLDDGGAPRVEFDHGGKTFRLWTATATDWRLSVRAGDAFQEIRQITPGHAARDPFLVALGGALEAPAGE